MMTFKRCPQCNTTKPATEYHKNRLTKSGLVSYCKQCTKEYQRALRVKKKALTPPKPPKTKPKPPPKPSLCERRHCKNPKPPKAPYGLCEEHQALVTGRKK